MNRNMNKPLLLTLVLSALISCEGLQPLDLTLKLNDQEYYERQGLNFLVFSNWYNGYFSDSKMSGVEIIHHEVRTVTNGDVRLNRTPEQWDPIPQFVERKVDKSNSTIEAHLKYPEHQFEYMIKSAIDGEDLIITVNLSKPVPNHLIGKAGFNLEFLPAAYFEKSYIIDAKSGILPLYPSSTMEVIEGKAEPMAIASGNVLTMAPEDQARRITIKSDQGLSLYDGRNQAQNGWYVVRSLIPEGKTGEVIKWRVSASTIPNWIRKPVIGHSQVGYHPDQEKVAIIEIDKNDDKAGIAILYRVKEDGQHEKVWTTIPEYYGAYNRYHYSKFDFSFANEEGIYFLKYNNTRTAPFRISKDVYRDSWHATNDMFFPVQMDHVLVNEAYRVWHGKSHMDDALQAPVNHTHFDLYAQGPSTDTPYAPGEHIPGLNKGGWYDAGDYDIRTQTQYRTVQNLVHVWETFEPTRDQVLVDYTTNMVDLHHPDGRADILQQIEHGAIALVAQHEAVGHAIPGIIVPTIDQYTHLGDGLTMTDNLIFDKRLKSYESNGFNSGLFDDRWAFTSKSSALNYGSIAGMISAYRALRNDNVILAEKAKKYALKAWKQEQSNKPDTFRVGNTTGGRLEDERFKAAVEMLVTFGSKEYYNAVKKYWPEVREQFSNNVISVMKVYPQMDSIFQNEVRTMAVAYKGEIDSLENENPYQIRITRGGWAGNGSVIRQGINCFLLGQAFPDLFDKEYVLRTLNYLYGTHPGSDISFISSVGTVSKKVAYGMNRADFSFIAGGIVPGVLILPPDFPENKEDWPFLWGENEYVINLGAEYILLTLAAQSLLE